MAIQMTRKEYEKMFGISPVLNVETFNTTPPPVRMTQAEYDATFRPKQKTGIQKVGGQIKQSFTEGFEKSTKGLEKVTESVKGIKDVDSVAEARDLYKQYKRGGLRFLGGAVDAAFAPLAPVFAPVGKGVGKVADKISDIPTVQKFASGKYGEEAIEKTQDALDIINIASVIPVTKLASGATSQIARNIPSVDTIRATQRTRAVNKISNEILNIENSYNKTAIKNTLSDDTGNASRKRIANTDVLTRIVDEDGKITTQSAKDAANAYREQTIGGAEGVVRDILKNEGKTVNLEQARKMLVNEISSSGLQGADLVTAMNGIKKEIAGLKLRADEFGNVPLYTLHDAKISTTKNIDYTKPPEISYRRSLANGYRKMIENVSEAKVEVQGKSYGIKQINEKLGEYLGDIERIEMLGGKRVKGGRLGKYTAQISGNLAGAGVGGVFGGPIGMAIGTIVGGEVASKIRGKQMASTFGKARGKVAPKSDVLEASKLKAKEGKVTDLRTPDPKVGAPKTIKKTAEILKVERQIAKNVVEQKKAIKAGNFTLVAALKEVYNALVDTLKSIIKRIKETPNQQGGFIANPFSDSSKAGNQLGKEKVKSTYNKDIPRATKKSSSLSTPKKSLLQSAKENLKKNGQAGFAQILKPYKETGSLTTKILKDLEGKTTVSKQYILDATNRGELKQVERDLIRRVLDEGEDVKRQELIKNYGEDIRFARVSDIATVESNINPETLAKYRKEFDPNKPFAISVGEGYRGQGTHPEKSLPLRAVDRNHRLQILKEKGVEYAPVFEGKGESLRHSNTISLDEYLAKNKDTINVSDFAKKVKAELLPLKVTKSFTKMGEQGRYENITLPDELRGNVANYRENIYESPIKTSAGSTHFGSGASINGVKGTPEGYFGHTRIEDMADNKTRRVIEVQSDLYQKGNLEREKLQRGDLSVAQEKSYGTPEEIKQWEYFSKKNMENGLSSEEKNTWDKLAKSLYERASKERDIKLQKLQQYNDPTAHFRMVREEIKKAAQDGKTKLQFPTGETALKIEGIGERKTFTFGGEPVKISELKVGREIKDRTNMGEWTIIEVGQNGQFKAAPTNLLIGTMKQKFPNISGQDIISYIKNCL